MRTPSSAFLATALIAAATTAATGCTDPGDAIDDADAVAAALEQENGGLDMEDEAPAFDAAEDFERAALEATTVRDDAMADDAEVVRLGAAPGAVRASLILLWGQLPPDRAPEDYARDWSGRISVSRGALIVRRTIGFEDATDALAPRTDRTFVDVTSITRPFADGLVLTVIDPEPDSGPLTLSFALADGTSHDLGLAELLAGPVVRVVDDQGDKLAAIALRDRDACDHGFARGRWRALRPGVGGMIGQIADADGELIGHLRGVWGERRDGEQVFFAKFVGVEGEFRGILAGHYRDGALRGRWLTRDGEHGRLHGTYEESLPGRPAGGHFALRWAETSCAADFPVDAE